MCSFTNWGSTSNTLDMTNKFNRIPKQVFLVLLFAFSIKSVSAITATVKGSLPSVVRESSGLDFNGYDSYWTHNDGYGDNRLYRVSATGALQQTITINGAINNDWEDLTHDAQRNYLFIGDFGNNNCVRTNLKIFRIPYPGATTTSVSAQAISFTYSDQSTFSSSWLNFDVESFFHFNGSLYLFSKADGVAVGYTKMYRLPDSPGSYVATLVDSFYTNDRTTSADITADGSAMILMSNSHLHIFKNFTGANFFSGQHTQVNISGAWSQKESLSFVSNNEIYMSDEDNGSGNFVYYLNLSSYIPSSSINAIADINETKISTYPNPALSQVNFGFDKTCRSVNILFFDIMGNVILNNTFDNTNLVNVDVVAMARGIYFYKIFVDGKQSKVDRLMIE